MKVLILTLALSQAADYIECIEEQTHIIQENEDGKTKKEILEEVEELTSWCDNTDDNNKESK